MCGLIRLCALALAVAGTRGLPRWRTRQISSAGRFRSAHRRRHRRPQLCASFWQSWARRGQRGPGVHFGNKSESRTRAHGCFCNSGSSQRETSATKHGNASENTSTHTLTHVVWCMPCVCVCARASVCVCVCVSVCFLRIPRCGSCERMSDDTRFIESTSMNQKSNDNTCSARDVLVCVYIYVHTHLCSNRDAGKATGGRPAP